MRLMKKLLLPLLLVFCSDPVPDAQLSALPNEAPGIPVGEYHRAGQPCVVCHGPNGPASDTPFSVAGTIFAQPQNEVGVDGATVAFTDSAGSSFTVTTNCVGNFWVPRPGTGDGAATWDPEFPIYVRAWDKSGQTIRTMQGQIGRERSCANCHYDPDVVDYPDEAFSAVGHISLFLSTDNPPPPSSTCPVNPVVSQ